MNINRCLILFVGCISFVSLEAKAESTFSIKSDRLGDNLTKTIIENQIEKQQINSLILHKTQGIYYFKPFDALKFGRADFFNKEAGYLNLVAKEAEFLTQH